MSRLTRDGTVELVSRDQILRHVRGQGNIHFPCSADHEQDWQPYPVDPYFAICDDHTYMHTYIHTSRLASLGACSGTGAVLAFLRPVIPHKLARSVALSVVDVSDSDAVQRSSWPTGCPRSSSDDDSSSLEPSFTGSSIPETPNFKITNTKNPLIVALESRHLRSVHECNGGGPFRQGYPLM